MRTLTFVLMLMRAAGGPAELTLVAEVNPYHVSDDMRWMEERIGAARSKGAYEALEASMKGPAWASFEEDRTGMLKAGYLADTAVFDRDLVELGRTRPAGLLDARVVLTLVGGNLVYQR